MVHLDILVELLILTKTIDQPFDFDGCFFVGDVLHANFIYVFSDLSVLLVELFQLLQIVLGFGGLQSNQVIHNVLD